MATALTSLALRPRRSEVKPPLVRVKTVFQRGEAPEILEVEANLDPLEVLKAAGVGLLVGGVTLAAGWVLWEGLTLPSPVGAVRVIRGAKETPFWQAEAARARDLLQARRDHKSFKNAGTTIAGGLDVATRCEELHQRWRSLRSTSWWLLPERIAELKSIEQEAEILGCPWLANP